MRHRLQRSAIHDPKWEGDVEALARCEWRVPKRETDRYIGPFRIVQDHAGTVLYTNNFGYVYEDLSGSITSETRGTWYLELHPNHVHLLDGYSGSTQYADEKVETRGPLKVSNTFRAAQISGRMHLRRQAGRHCADKRHASARHRLQITAGPGLAKRHPPANSHCTALAICSPSCSAGFRVECVAACTPRSTSHCASPW